MHLRTCKRQLELDSVRYNILFIEFWWHKELLLFHPSGFREFEQKQTFYVSEIIIKRKIYAKMQVNCTAANIWLVNASINVYTVLQCDLAPNKCPNKLAYINHIQKSPLCQHSTDTHTEYNNTDITIQEKNMKEKCVIRNCINGTEQRERERNGLDGDVWRCHLQRNIVIFSIICNPPELTSR